MKKDTGSEKESIECSKERNRSQKQSNQAKEEYVSLLEKHLEEYCRNLLRAARPKDQEL